MRKLMSHKSDKVPCCLSPLVHTFMILVADILRDETIPADYLIAHSNYARPDQLHIYTGCSVFASFTQCLCIAMAVQQKYKP